MCLQLSLHIMHTFGAKVLVSHYITHLRGPPTHNELRPSPRTRQAEIDGKRTQEVQLLSALAARCDGQEKRADDRS